MLWDHGWGGVFSHPVVDICLRLTLAPKDDDSYTPQDNASTTPTDDASHTPKANGSNSPRSRPGRDDVST